MTIQVGGYGVQRGTLTMPLRGVWHFEGLVDADSGLEPGEFANIEIEGGATLFGVIRRGGVALELAEIQVVGGAGGLSNELGAKGYKNATARIIALDIMTETGESLAASSDPALASTTLAQWHRTEASAGAALDELTSAIGMSWRVLDDGTVWIGTDSYTPITLPTDAELVTECRPIAQRTYADDTLAARPGTTIDGTRVVHVVHRIDPNGHRTDVYAPRETGEESDPIRSAIAGFINRVLRRVDYHALYPARVVSQGVDNTLDVQPDGTRIAPLRGVPIRTFAPDVVVKVSPGARVLIGFEAGDPRLPYASLWQSGALVSVAIAGDTDAAALASLITSNFDAIVTTLGTGSNSGGPVMFGTPFVPTSVASTKLKLGS